MLLVQPPCPGPARLGLSPLCFDYNDFDADSEVGCRLLGQQHRRQRYHDDDEEEEEEEEEEGQRRTPVVMSATMSVVDFGGGGCLGFGHGFGGVGGTGGGGGTTPDVIGRRGSVPLAAELAVSSTGTSSSFFAPRERGYSLQEQEYHWPTPSRKELQRQSAPLALFARIKKQLSGVSVGAASGRPASGGFVKGENGMAVAGGDEEPSIFLPTTTKPPSTTSAKRNQRRRRQQKQHRVSGSGDTQQQELYDGAFSSPSIYSCSSASRESSFIGSSASFLELERGGKMSRDRGSDFMMHPRAQLPLADDGHDSINNDITSTYTANSDTSAASYVPYLPIIIQHERLQARLKVPVPLDAVSVVSASASVSALSVESKSRQSRRSASGASSKASHQGAGSVPSGSRPGSSSRETQKEGRGGGKQRPRTPKKGDVQVTPPPPSPSRSTRTRPSVSPSRNPRARTHPYASSSQNRDGAGIPPSSPTSPTSSSTDTSASPVTPNTPGFFTAPLKGKAGVSIVQENSEADPKRNSSGKALAHSRSTPRLEEKRQSIVVHKDVNVNVLPPTPTTPTGFGSDGSQQQSSSSSSSSPPANHQPGSPSSPLNRARSRSRQNLGKAPPPPSGPLPLPPLTQTRSRSQSDTQTRTQTQTKPPLSSHPSLELAFPTTHSRHSSPFVFGSDKRNKAKANTEKKEVFVDTGSELRFVAVDLKQEEEEVEDIILGGPLYTSESDDAPSGYYSHYSHHQPSLSESASLVVPNFPHTDIVDVFALHEERLKKAKETEKIGVGRQQVAAQQRCQRRSRGQRQRQSQEAQELEWTLCLGADASVPPAVPSSATAVLSLSSPAATAAVIPQLTVTLSPSSPSSLSCSQLPPSPPTPSSSPPSLSTPYKDLTPAQARMRTKSESALGRAVSSQDWTLMLPLPPLSTRPEPTTTTAAITIVSSPSPPFSLPSSSSSPSALSSSPPPQPPTSSSSLSKTGTAKDRYSDPTPLSGALFDDDTSSVGYSTDMHVRSVSVDAQDDGILLRVPHTDADADADLGGGGCNHRPTSNLLNRAVEEIVLCVPRVVSHGSGMSMKKTRKKARSTTSSLSRMRSLVMPDQEDSVLLSSSDCERRPNLKAAARVAFDVNDNDDDDDQSHSGEKRTQRPHRKRSSKLAKLDALSADLVRFNEMLRSASAAGGAGAGSGGVGEQFHRYSASSFDSGFLHGAPGPLGPGVGSAKPKLNATSAAAGAFVGVKVKQEHSNQQQLKHTRSHGILEVDEPPPPHAILRVPSVGDLFLGEDVGVGGGVSSRVRVDSRVRSDSRVRVDSRASRSRKEVMAELPKENPGVSATAPMEEVATTTTRVSMGAVSPSSSSSMSSARSTSRMSVPSDTPAPAPASASPVAPFKRTSVQSFSSVRSSTASLSSNLSVTPNSPLSPTKKKIRPPLPFAPSPSVFGGYSATASSSSSSPAAAVARGRSGSSSASCSVGGNANAAASRKLSGASLSSVSREKEKGSLRGSLRVVTDSPKRRDVAGVVVIVGGGERERGGDEEARKEEEEESEVEAKARTRLSSSSIISMSSVSSSFSSSSGATQPALRVDTSLLSFPSNTTLKPSLRISSSSSSCNASIRSSRSSSGSLTPTASPKSQFHSKHTLMPTVSPDGDYYDSYDESESAAPTPLASSFPVPPAFPTLGSSLPSSLSVSVADPNSNSNLNMNGNMNGDANERTRPAVKRYHAPGTSDSTRTITPLHFRGLSLEERIRQLRVLGVDNGVPGEELMQERVPMTNVVPVPLVEKESDEESLCSGSYYSARSSFSSERGWS